MDHRLQRVGDALEAGIPFGLPLALVERAEMIDLDHDDGDALALARGTTPLALEKFLEMLLGVEAGDGVDGRVAQQLVLDERQLFGSLVQRRLERLFAAPRAARAEQVPGTDEQDGEEGKHIGHGPALF